MTNHHFTWINKQSSITINSIAHNSIYLVQYLFPPKIRLNLSTFINLLNTFYMFVILHLILFFILRFQYLLNLNMNNMLALVTQLLSNETWLELCFFLCILSWLFHRVKIHINQHASIFLNLILWLNNLRNSGHTWIIY